jgi:hypothetical protein
MLKEYTNGIFPLFALNISLEEEQFRRPFINGKVMVYNKANQA